MLLGKVRDGPQPDRERKAKKINKILLKCSVGQCICYGTMYYYNTAMRYITYNTQMPM